MLGGQPVLGEQHPHPAGPAQPGRQLTVAGQRPELESPAVQEQQHPAGIRPGGGQPVGRHPAAFTSVTCTSSGTGYRRSPGTKAARSSASVGGGWLALARCRSRMTSIASCMAWAGMSASPRAWAACPTLVFPSAGSRQGEALASALVAWVMDFLAGLPELGCWQPVGPPWGCAAPPEGLLGLMYLRSLEAACPVTPGEPIMPCRFRRERGAPGCGDEAVS